MGQGGQIKLLDRKNEDIHLLWSHGNNCSKRLVDPLGLPDIVVLMSLTETYLMVKPTWSPGTASVKDSLFFSMDLISVQRLIGANVKSATPEVM